MAEALTEIPATPRKRILLPLLTGGGLAAVLGAAGFYAGANDLLPLPGFAPDHEEGIAAQIAFVKIEPLIVTLAPGSGARHLRLSAELEVDKAHLDEVQMLMPRILDVLNGYLRAVATPDLESPSALVRLRAQMLRRIQIVTGDGRVRDFLVTEFVLS